MAEQAPAPVTQTEVEARDIERGPQEFNDLYKRRAGYEVSISSLKDAIKFTRLANDKERTAEIQGQITSLQAELRDVIGFWDATGAQDVEQKRKLLDRLMADPHISDADKKAAEADLNQATLAFYNTSRELALDKTREHDVDAAYDTATDEDEERNSQSKAKFDAILSEFSDTPEFLDDQLSRDSDSDSDSVSHPSIPAADKMHRNYPQWGPEAPTDSPVSDDESEPLHLSSASEPFQYDSEEGSLIPELPSEPIDMPGNDVPALGVNEPSDYGFKVENGQNKRFAPLREGIGRLNFMLTQSKSYAGEKLGRSMNWLRKWGNVEGLTEKEQKTRKFLGGVAIVGLAAGVAFGGWKLAEAGSLDVAAHDALGDLKDNINTSKAGWDIITDNIGDAWDNLTGPETGTITGVEDVTEVDQVDPPVEANGSELPAPEDFKDEHAWDWAVEAYGEGNAMSELHELSEKAAADGHTVEWHGSGTNEWVEIDGNSKTQDVLTILRQYA